MSPPPKLHTGCRVGTRVTPAAGDGVALLPCKVGCNPGDGVRLRGGLGCPPPPPRDALSASYFSLLFSRGGGHTHTLGKARWKEGAPECLHTLHRPGSPAGGGHPPKSPPQPSQGPHCNKIRLPKDGCPHPGVGPPSPRPQGWQHPTRAGGPFLCLLRLRESGVWFSV